MPCETAASWSDVCAPSSSPQSACHSPFLPLARPLTFQKATSTDSPALPPPFLFLSLLSLSHHFFPSSRDSWFFLYHSFCNSSRRPLPNPFCSSFPSTMSIRSLFCASPSAETFGFLTPCFSLLSSTHSTVAPACSLAVWVQGQEEI